MKYNTAAFLKKSLLCGAFCVAASVPLAAGAAAADVDAFEFDLDPMVVTARRIDTKDLDTPASVEVFNAEQIAKSGAANAYDVLKNTLGVVSQSQGFNGTSMGTMTSKIMIRGVQKGTLVLVNGVAMNLDGKYNLDDIPTESIEKIEVVKGGGAVLYGSEATGGVINIITKKSVKNKVSAAAGNFDKQRYNMALGVDDFSIIAGYEHRGKATHMSEPAITGRPTVYDYGKGERTSVLWNYKIVDGLTVTHNYSRNKNRYLINNSRTGKLQNINDYKDIDNRVQLQYDKDDWKAHISYGTQEKNYDKDSKMNSWRKGHGSDVDVQRLFKLGGNNLLVGTTWQREDMDLKSGTKKVESDMTRDMYSIYMSYDIALNDQSNLYLNARETWATRSRGNSTDLKTGKKKATENDSQSKFTPEVEYLYRINNSSSFYAKAGKSFRMPNLTQIYGMGMINPKLDLKPEQGTHYEIGYKKSLEKSSWRVALYNFIIKDSISADVKYAKDGTIDKVDYRNEDVRNTGIEVSCNLKHDDNWSTSWGATLNNPQCRNSSTYGDSDWHDYYSKYQLTGGVNYQEGKFTGSLSANFVGDRTSTRASKAKPQRHIKPQLFTNMHFTYKAEKDQKVFLHVNNILDRLDITSNSTSNYLSLGRNFMLGYEYNF